LLSLVLEVFRSYVVPIRSEADGSTSQSFRPSSATSRVRPLHRGSDESLRSALAPPMRFFRPFGERSAVSRLCSDPPERLSPSGLSRTLEGLILTEPCGHVSYRCRPWGSGSSGLISSRRPLPSSSPGETLSTFLHVLRGEAWSRPQGLLPCGSSYPTVEYFIHGKTDALLSFSFAFTALLHSSWSCPSTAHPLLTFLRDRCLQRLVAGL
jgi:hypothetical protein